MVKPTTARKTPAKRKAAAKYTKPFRPVTRAQMLLLKQAMARFNALCAFDADSLGHAAQHLESDAMFFEAVAHLYSTKMGAVIRTTAELLRALEGMKDGK